METSEILNKKSHIVLYNTVKGREREREREQGSEKGKVPATIIMSSAASYLQS